MGIDPGFTLQFRVCFVNLFCFAGQGISLFRSAAAGGSILSNKGSLLAAAGLKDHRQRSSRI